MPNDDDEFESPDYWDEAAASEIFDDVLDNVRAGYEEGDSLADRMENDNLLQVLYFEGLYDLDLPVEERVDLYEKLIEHMWDTYGLDWDDIFDWEAWREWYG